MVDVSATSHPARRDWALVGARDAPERALVDPCGLVTPTPGGWSLDWWIGADDRWHLPAIDAGVRQRLVGAAPVVETAMRIPSGDAVARVYAVRATADDGGGDFAVVEVENRSPVPVALAFAVRPANPLGSARVERIEAVEVAGGIDPGGGPAGGGRRGLRVDGRLGVVLPREPARSVACTAADGDCLDVVIAGAAPDGVVVPVDDPAGGASAAVVFPLPHAAVLRALLPLHLPEVRRGRAARRGPAATVRVPDRVPTGEQVAKGWEAQGDRGLRAQLPDARLTHVFEAARRWLLVAHAGADVVDGGGVRPAGALAVADLVPVVAALDELGFTDEAAQVLASWEERVGTDGSFAGPQRRLDANGAALWVAARHWDLQRDEALAERLVGPLAKAAQWIARRRRSRRDRRDPTTVGLLPDGGAPAFARGPDDPDTRYRDDLWSLAGLRRAAAMFTATRQPEVGRAVGDAAADLAGVVEAALAEDARRAGRPYVPLGPGRPPGLDVVAGLDALAVGALDPGHPAVGGTLDVLAAAGVGPGGVADPRGAGVRPALTAWLARLELAAGRTEPAAGRLRWLVDHATPVVTWPEVRSPGGHGVDGAGFDVVAAAAVCSLVRDLLVRERPGRGGLDGLALLSWVPIDWYGQGVEVHDAPTADGRLSFAVRWHGERPALLWELVAHDAAAPVQLTAPGLDPAWSTDRPAGEALLAPPPSRESWPEAVARPAPSPGGEPFPGGSFS